MKRQVLRLMRAAGYEIVRAPSRASLTGFLGNLRRLGFSPATVVDVGAAYGDFTRQCLKIFPQSKYILIEPLEEYRSALRALESAHTDIRLIEAAAARRDQSVSINVHPDLVGSSLYREREGEVVDGVPRLIPGVSLDSCIGSDLGAGPLLLKIDVQGAERDVLDGAGKTLAGIEVVLLELSLFEFFEGGPSISEMIGYMEARGFVPYDVFGLSHRPLDGALAQIDMAFVPRNGQLRQDHRYATDDQRRELTRRLRR